jgi:hypothetical protein
MTIARLLSAEIFIIVVISVILCGMMVAALDYFSNDLVRALFIR